MVGPYVGFGRAVVLAMTQNPWLGLAVLIFAILAQLVEGNYLVPKIMNHAVGISPLTTVLAMLSGATLFGLVGAILALPVAGMLQVLA